MQSESKHTERENSRVIPPLPTRMTSLPRSRLGKWLFNVSSETEKNQAEKTFPWHKVLWLTGVDYFSTLGYQPGIALLAAGMLSPIATIILILVTLLCALPVYSQVSLRSYAGQGSIAMLENLFRGWKAKVVVLILLGFASTDFIITMTLSSADAAVHLIENPYFHAIFESDNTILITLGLLAMLTVVFLKGFTEALTLAASVTIPYIVLNLIVLIRGLFEIVSHPNLISDWHMSLSMQGDFTGLVFASILIFPKLALGMSGFETAVSVMPLVSNGEKDQRGDVPLDRIHSTKKMLSSAAIIMAVMLLLSSLVTTLLLSSSQYSVNGPASGRAIAFLAHQMLGDVFGTVYDISTIIILWFAGASAMAGLLNIIPRYLPRYGMAPRWLANRRPLVLVIFTAAILVTFAFNANVEAQSGAYATGVLVLMLSAAIAVAVALWKEFRVERLLVSKTLLKSFYFWLVTLVFVFTLFDNVIERPDGVIISGMFITFIIFISALSRLQRSVELRVSEITLVDDESVETWNSIIGRKIHLVPVKDHSPEHRALKELEIRKYYSITGPIGYIHVNLLDNRSEFIAQLRVKVIREGDNYLIEISGANAVANAIAYVSELVDPKSIFLSLTRQNLMNQSFRFLLWGEGETGLMVYSILLHYWEWTKDENVRPAIFLMSE